MTTGGCGCVPLMLLLRLTLRVSASSREMDTSEKVALSPSGPMVTLASKEATLELGSGEVSVQFRPTRSWYTAVSPSTCGGRVGGGQVQQLGTAQRSRLCSSRPAVWWMCKWWARHWHKRGVEATWVAEQPSFRPHRSAP